MRRFFEKHGTERSLLSGQYIPPSENPVSQAGDNVPGQGKGQNDVKKAKLGTGLRGLSSLSIPVQKKQTDMSVRSAAVTFVNEGISEEAEQVLEETSVELSNMLNPKVVDDEKEQVLDENAQTIKLNESLKLINEELPLQIFNGPSTEPRETLNIRKLK